mgnify:CR=1 FL=1
MKHVTDSRFQTWDSLDVFFNTTDDGVLYMGHASILTRLSDRGLILVSGGAVEHGPHAGAPVIVGDAISPDLSRRQLDQMLAALQDRARRDGSALGIVVATPNLLPHLAAWLASLEKQSIALAPATAMLSAAPGTGVAAK